MSVIYLAICAGSEGVGVAVFKSSGQVRTTSTGAIELSLSMGELLRAQAWLPGCFEQQRDHRYLESEVARALLVKQWFDQGPPVGGACVPEEFITDSLTTDQYQPLLAAILMAWSLDYPSAVVADVDGGRYRTSVITQAGGDGAIDLLSQKEREIAHAEVTPRIGPWASMDKAIAIGLRHLGRWTARGTANV